jgi:hypothetical protein
LLLPLPNRLVLRQLQLSQLLAQRLRLLLLLEAWGTCPVTAAWLLLLLLLLSTLLLLLLMLLQLLLDHLTHSDCLGSSSSSGISL